jgi:hypothetical protein
VLIVARSILRSRCDSVRPRRIVQHLQGFGFGPLVGRLAEEGFIRRKGNRQRHKCEHAKAVKSDLTQLGKKEDGRMGTIRYAHAIRSHPKEPGLGSVNSPPFGTFGKGVLTNLL